MMKISNDSNPAGKNDSLDFALGAAEIGIWDLIPGEDSPVIWNEHCRAFFGITDKKDFSCKALLDYVHDSDRKRAIQAIESALDPKSGEKLDLRCSIIGVEDGIIRQVRFTGKAFFDDKGKAIRFAGIAMDVGDEISARDEKEKLKYVVHNSPDFMGISNNSGKIEFLNPAAYKLLGIDPETDLNEINSIDFYETEEFGRIGGIYKIVREKGSWAGNIFLRHFQTGEIIPCFATYETIVDQESGVGIGRSVTVRDLREELKAKKALQENEALFRNVTQNAPTGLWMSDTEGGLIYLNRTLVDWTGMTYESLLGAGWANAIIDEDREQGARVFLDAVQTRTHYDARFRIRKGDGTICWCRASGDPYEDENGNYAGYAGFCMDIHQLVEMAAQISDSEEKIRNIVEQAPIAIGVLRGEDFIVESGNETILKLWGKDSSIIGKPILKALPELEGQIFIDLLSNVYQTGIPHHGNSVLANIEHDGRMQDSYFDFVYTPIRDTGKEISGILVVASDVTKQVVAKQLIEQSEAKFRGLIEEAPIATAVLVGRELIIDVANQPMLELWGKGEAIMGMPLAQALPELKGQPFLQIFEDIFNTGETYGEEEARAELVIDGILRTFYFNFTYKPLFDGEGKVYAIMDMAVDVTEQVLNKQKIIEAETQLRSAIENADLGTWEVHLLTGEYKASERLKKWYGFDTGEKIQFQDVLERIPSHEHLVALIQDAITGKEKGKINVEYNVVNKNTGRVYVMESQGQAFYNEDGIPFLLIGSTRDITLQRENEMEMERLVQERTEELQATNEEMAATNEELADANDHLFHSNEELAQYAYVASHDLQEPLRKIRMFADILSRQPSLSEENRPIVDKINRSSERMTLLIKDLLEFSRVSRSESVMKEVNLNQIMKDVTTDFELVISEKKATIRIDQLPIVEAIGLQMNQMFYNLLSNALKFTGHHQTAEILVSSRILSAAEVSGYIPKPSHRMYYDIIFEDNGIGFEKEYAEQIFEVFKRLHGKEVYPGSGIGLALCRRIAMNHGGHLYAESVVGKGTRFHLILPGS